MTQSFLTVAPSSSQGWTRRAWLTHHSAVALLATSGSWTIPRTDYAPRRGSSSALSKVSGHPLAERVPPGQLEALAQRAVEAARAAGARYADARLTRDIQHHYRFTTTGEPSNLAEEVETLGVGVRALVDGYWGFVASAVWTPEEVTRLATEAVAQARVNAKGTPRTVELGQYPVASGTWTTPIGIDPFTVSIEEKTDFLDYWVACLDREGLYLDPQHSYVHFARQERVVATTEGTCVRQTCYESGGVMVIAEIGRSNPSVRAQGIDVCGKGWELFLEAKLPEQFTTMLAEIRTARAVEERPLAVGRYTLVCDGATMARLVEQTLGIATQLDRALGYEANAGGTSYITDPLTMLGDLQLASPLVTVTANRSSPTQLATVKWDDEGVEPVSSTLVKDGVLTDFQTTREQAVWLAPYYAKKGSPVRSHGYAASEDARVIPIQHMPNLMMASSASSAQLSDLIANVTDGILLTEGKVQTDHQARTGILQGEMRKITKGRLGHKVKGGAIQFNTTELWKNVVALGGPVTQATVGVSALTFWESMFAKLGGAGKGQPVQLTSHSINSVAASITNQPIINLSRRA